MNTHSRLLKRLINPAKEVDWERVFTEQLPRVYNYFRFRVGDDQLAEDLTQSTFEKAWKARSRYRYDLGAFTTWLLTIAGRTLTDYYRKQPKAELSWQFWHGSPPLAHIQLVKTTLMEALQKHGRYP